MRRVALAAATIALCAGCPSLVARSHRHPLGHVDLSTPPDHENGDPATYEAPIDPGEHRAGIYGGAYVTPGFGRRGGGGDMEVGVQVRALFGKDLDESSARDDFPVPLDGWGGTIGWGFLQAPLSTGDQRTSEMGPIYAEVHRQWLAFGVGAGLAIYPTHGVEAGPQLTAWAWPFVVRTRYEPDSGFEIYGGYEIELPTAWVWSR